MIQHTTVYDVIVVGAGVEGSATALTLVGKAQNCTVAILEQFQLGHTRGSSHGGSRITRSSYDVQYYADMMSEAFKLWSNIETKAGTQLFYKTHGTFFGHPDSAIKSIIDNFQRLGCDHEVLSGQEANDRYKFFCLPNDFVCAVDKTAGVLAANKALHALQSLFIKKGGTIFDSCQVTSINPSDVITLETCKGSFKAKKIVITAGPWTSRILKPLGLELPLKVQRSEVFYWKVDHPDLCTVGSSARTMGVFGQSLEKNISCYGIPSFEYPGLVKISPHNATEVDPDHRDANPSPNALNEVSKFIETFFQGISTTPSIVELIIFLITTTPDDDFILDQHPQYSNIFIGAGFSGHGFKLAPVVGKLLAEMALDQPSSYDLQPFKLSRLLK